MEIKICSKCKIEKSVTLFSKDKSRKDGLKLHCKDCRKIESKIYREKNPEKRKETIKKYYENNKELISQKQKKFKSENYEKWKKIKLDSFHKNKIKNADKIKQRNKLRQDKKTIYQRNKIKTDILYKISTICRSRVSKLLKRTNTNKNNSTYKMLGCTPLQLKEHLESKFTDNMSWDNYGFYGWHIDHIIPLSSAKNEEELKRLCHYTNLQPLWCTDNLSKGSKIL